MTPRTIRRAAERKASKQARKADRLLAATSEPVADDASQSAPTNSNETSSRFTRMVATRLQELTSQRESRLSEARIAINRANAQSSTGPKTPEGKAASCLNNTKYGLTGTRFTVLDWEDRAEFDQLLNSIQDEYRPATAIEQILVEKIAQHHWLSQRALLLQNLSFDSAEPRCESEPQQKQLALYLRYQATHERAFHKCIDQLIKIRAVRQKEANGFESQKRREAADVRKQETHQVRVRIANARAECQERLNAGRRTPSASPISTVSMEKSGVGPAETGIAFATEAAA